MSEVVARLTQLEAGRPSRVYELVAGTLRVGRDERAELRIEHGEVSRFHAELELNRGGGVIRDLDSKNGLRVDGVRVEQAPLDARAQTRIALGKLDLLLEFVDARVDHILARSGELTVRRPVPPDPAPAEAPRSLLLPLLTTLAFAALLLALLIFG